ncbi:MAG: class I SAM-dependent methyltransferase [Gemmatimonadaceae bacterium]
MVSCCQCEGIEREFGDKRARKELRRLRRRGPIRTTKLLIEALRAEGVSGASLLDVGGGVGAVHHELLDAGAGDAVHVDISPAYLDAASHEAARRGHVGRVRFVRGDFVAVADEVGAADVVTLDRVMCCYPDMERLVDRSAERAQRLYGAVYPRDAWWVRTGAAVTNAFLRVRRTDFRSYVHPPAAIEARLAGHGFERRSARRTLVWTVAVYARRGSA